MPDYTLTIDGKDETISSDHELSREDLVGYAKKIRGMRQWQSKQGTGQLLRPIPNNGMDAPVKGSSMPAPTVKVKGDIEAKGNIHPLAKPAYSPAELTLATKHRVFMQDRYNKFFDHAAVLDAIRQGQTTVPDRLGREIPMKVASDLYQQAYGHPISGFGQETDSEHAMRSYTDNGQIPPQGSHTLGGYENTMRHSALPFRGMQRAVGGAVSAAIGAQQSLAGQPKKAKSSALPRASQNRLNEAVGTGVLNVAGMPAGEAPAIAGFAAASNDPFNMLQNLAQAGLLHAGFQGLGELMSNEPPPKGLPIAKGKRPVQGAEAPPIIPVGERTSTPSVSPEPVEPAETAPKATQAPTISPAPETAVQPPESSPAAISEAQQVPPAASEPEALPTSGTDVQLSPELEAMAEDLRKSHADYQAPRNLQPREALLKLDPEDPRLDEESDQYDPQLASDVYNEFGPQEGDEYDPQLDDNPQEALRRARQQRIDAAEDQGSDTLKLDEAKHVLSTKSKPKVDESLSPEQRALLAARSSAKTGKEIYAWYKGKTGAWRRTPTPVKMVRLDGFPEHLAREIQEFAAQHGPDHTIYARAGTDLGKVEPGELPKGASRRSELPYIEGDLPTKNSVPESSLRAWARDVIRNGDPQHLLREAKETGLTNEELESVKRHYAERRATQSDDSQAEERGQDAGSNPTGGQDQSQPSSKEKPVASRGQKIVASAKADQAKYASEIAKHQSLFSGLDPEYMLNVGKFAYALAREFGGHVLDQVDRVVATMKARGVDLSPAQIIKSIAHYDEVNGEPKSVEAIPKPAEKPVSKRSQLVSKAAQSEPTGKAEPVETGGKSGDLTTSLANRTQSQHVEQGRLSRLPEKGTAKSPEDVHAEGKEFQSLDDAEKLGKRIVSGMAETDHNFTLAKEADRMFHEAINKAEAEHAKLVSEGASHEEIATADAHADNLRRRHLAFLDDVQKGKGGWHNIGITLQTGSNVLSGDIEDVLNHATSVKNRGVAPGDAEPLSAQERADITKLHEDYVQKLKGEHAQEMAQTKRRVSYLEKYIKDHGEGADKKSSAIPKTKSEVRVDRKAKILEGIRQERKSAIEAFHAASKGGGFRTRQQGSVQGYSPEQIQAIGRIARTYIDEGVLNVQDLAAKVSEDIGAKLSDSDVAKAFHAFVSSSDRPKTVSEATRFKKILALQGEYENALEGEFRNPRGKSVTDEQIQSLRQKLRDLKPKTPDDVHAKYVRALEAAQKALEDARAGRTRSKGLPAPKTEATSNVKAQIEDVRSELKKLRESKEHASKLAEYKRLEGLSDEDLRKHLEDEKAKADKKKAERESDEEYMRRRQEVADARQKLRDRIDAMSPQAPGSKWVSLARTNALAGINSAGHITASNITMLPRRLIQDIAASGVRKYGRVGGESISDFGGAQGVKPFQTGVKRVQGMFSKATVRRMGQVAKYGFNEIDALHGGDTRNIGARQSLPDMKGKNALKNVAPWGEAVIGRIHGVLHTPAQSAQFEASLLQNVEAMKQAGLDMSDPMNRQVAMVRAAYDAADTIFKGDNKAADAIAEAFRKVEKSPHVVPRVAGTLVHMETPTTKFPLNFLAQVYENTGFGLLEGARKGSAIKKMIQAGEKPTPEQIDSMVQSYARGIYGGLGASGALAMLMLHMADPRNGWVRFGGVYQPGQTGKNKPEVEPDTMQIKDLQGNWHVIPKMAIHSDPGLAALQMQATVLNEAAKAEDAKGKLFGAARGAKNAAMSQIEGVPGVSAAYNVAKLAQDSKGGEAGKQVRDLTIPQYLQALAKTVDKPGGPSVFGDPRQVDESSFGNAIQAGIPFARNLLPPKKGPHVQSRSRHRVR